MFKGLVPKCLFEDSRQNKGFFEPYQIEVSQTALNLLFSPRNTLKNHFFLIMARIHYGGEYFLKVL